jgi:hypothetical protein
MADVIRLIEAAQVAFGRRDWAMARDRFRAARDVGMLGTDDIFALAEAAWWLGEIDESLAAFEQAYRRPPPCWVGRGAPTMTGRRRG